MGTPVGSLTTNSLPCPAPALKASTLPPCISTSPLTRLRPMPKPPCEPASAWAKRSNTWGRISDAKPLPLSRMRTSHWLSRCSTVSQMLPPGSMYLAALVKEVEEDLLQAGRVAFEKQSALG